MKKIIFILTLLVVNLTGFCQRSIYIRGYTRSNGTYVQGHHRTTPNYTRNDNYSTIGNINPYTGSYGTHRGGLNSSYYSNNFRITRYITPRFSSYRNNYKRYFKRY